MIKKFQRRFTLLAMAALLLVLTMIIAGINIYNYNEVIRDADELLQIISSNRGSFPETESEDETNREEKPEPIFKDGKRDSILRDFSPETPYETRYFSVGISNETGMAEMIETSRISAVNDITAESYALRALEKNRTYGFVEDYRFYVVEGRHRTYVVFVDCGRMLSSAHSFLWGSVIISFVGYIVVFAIVSVLSRYAIRPISRSYEKQKQFITNAGHELKTPLTIIRADADVLEMEYGQNEWLADIQKQTRRLSDLTEELSKLARMDEPEHPLKMMVLPLSDMICEAVDSFRHLAQTRDIDLRCSIQPKLFFRGNDRAIQQLVTVILDNALKYAPENSTVTLSFEKNGKNLSLYVFNQSKNPLPCGNLDQLFERFYRTDPSRNSETGGYGIGLAVAKAIVCSHGGSIHATSEDGSSLAIQVLLPA